MIQGTWPLGAKTIALTLNGSAVSEEILSLTYTDDLNGSSEDVLLGSTCAAQLTMVIDHPQNEFDGGEITVSVGGVPLGRFTVHSARKRDGRLTLEAADAMCGDAMAEPYEPQSQTSTALSVIREIASGAGLELKDLTGITDVSVEGLGAGLTRREMLGRMAAVLGYHAHIDRAGKLALRWYADSGMEIGPDDYYAGGLNKQDADFVIGKIECTVSKLTTDADTDMERSETEILTAGEGSTGISISCPYMTQSALDSIFDRIGGFTYRPMTLELFGDCRIETGDLLTVEDLAGDSFSVPVMSVSHVWDGGVRTKITAAGKAPTALSAGGTLSEGLKRLEAEVGRFRNLVADYAQLTKADIQELFADWAQIGTAIINTLQATGVNADWINAGTLNAARIGAGTISADKLTVGQGGNLYPVYDSFEQVTNDTLSYLSASGATPAVVSTAYAYHGAKVLRIVTGSDVANGYVHLGHSSNGYGQIRLTTGRYVASGYARCTSSGSSASVRINVFGRDSRGATWDTGEYTLLGNATETIGTTWTRIEVPFTLSSNQFVSLSVVLQTASETIYCDCFQIEEVASGQGAGTWHPAGTTQIDGGTIVAQSIKAESLDVDSLFAEDITATGSFQIDNDYFTLTANQGGVDIQAKSNLASVKIGGIYCGQGTPEIGGNAVVAAMHKTVTGTTNTSGNIALSIPVNAYGVLCVWRSDATSVCTPYYPNSVTGWYAHVATTAGAAVTSTAVTLEVEYYYRIAVKPM